MADIVDTEMPLIEQPKPAAPAARPPVAAPAVLKPAVMPSSDSRLTERVTTTLENVSKQLESQSLTALSSGFFFAAALAWMDVSRAVIAQFVKGNKNGVLPMTLTALATTLLSILVFIIISSISPKIQRPSVPVYAVVGR